MQNRFKINSVRPICYSTLLLSFIVLIALPFDNQAIPLKFVQTRDMKLIHYSMAHEYILPHLGRCYENSLHFYQKLFDYNPSQPTGLFLQDFSDPGNAGATAVPYNYITVYISPFYYAYENLPTYERMSWLMNHEIVHVIAMDQAAPRDRLFRNLFFGKVLPEPENPISLFYGFLTSPRRYAPRWYHEGIACFLETWTNQGNGRILNPYYEMEFRSLVQGQDHIYDAVGLESEGTAIDFQVGSMSYLYGTRFFGYLAHRYGPDKLIEWCKRDPGSRAYFSSQFKNVYSRDLNSIWSEWIDYEIQWQTGNLERLRQNPVTRGKQITDRKLGSVSRPWFDRKDSCLYLAVLYPGELGRIIRLDIRTGTIKRLCDIKDAIPYAVSSLAYDESGRKLFFTTDNKHYRDLNQIDIETGKTRRLITDLRAGDLTFNPADRTLWGVRRNNGISTIIVIREPYTDWTALYAFPYGHDPYDLDISPDGRYLSAALSDISGKQRLVLMSPEKLLKGDPACDTLYDFDVSSPTNFVFSPDGRHLFGSSYYSGVSNIYRYDLEERDIFILTNSETGLFRPVPVTPDSLIAFQHSAHGFNPIWIRNQPQEKVSAILYQGQQIVEKYPHVKEWFPGSPKSIPLDSMITAKGDYHQIGDLKLRSAYPIVEGYKDYAAVGYRMSFMNSLAITRLNLNFSVSPSQDTPESERYHLGIQFKHWFWTLKAGYNTADFYDLFGPTKVSRKGHFGSIGYKKSLIFDTPRLLDLDIQLAGYGGLERLPESQNIAADYSEMVSLKSGLDYQFLQKSLGAVDDEKGYHLRLDGQTNLVNRHLYPRLMLKTDWGFPLPFPHSSLWLRNTCGFSSGKRDNPFANFYFGGFGNNWVDYQSEKRYLEYYSFPGMEINALGGTRFNRAMLECHLPPVRFSRTGNSLLYLRWARISMFGSSLITNPDHASSRREVYNLGSQLDLQAIFMSLHNLTLSLGYAVALEDRETSNEFMLSLKLF
ncbi:MAG: hypothetical protein KBA26_02080 [Candidatus Delongbacteria bacterium]|nr:hypothetical protein [Candidatus Delongbacteria bacterium]